jgi:DNA-binding LytR/AlgR family response regulator
MNDTAPPTITAIIADDEPLMRTRMRETLARAWPALRIVAECANGFEALAAFDAHAPTIAFLDIRMPGKSGLEVAAEIGDAAHIVFVTAYDEYAVSAFESGAADYVLKPVELDRLATTVDRLKNRLAAQDEVAAHAPDLSVLVKSLLERNQVGNRLVWLRASVANVTRLIHIDDVLFFQSDSKYTRVVMKSGEALVRTTLKELIEGLDADLFWQVHRGTIVCVRAIDRAVREGPEKLTLHIRDCSEKLTVSRQYFHLFKQD